MDNENNANDTGRRRCALELVPDWQDNPKIVAAIEKRCREANEFYQQMLDGQCLRAMDKASKE